MQRKSEAKKMKQMKIYSFLLWSILLISCGSSDTELALKLEKSAVIDTKTMLPFNELDVHKEETHALPKIKEFNYLALNTNFDFNFKNRTCIKNFKNYNNQLSDFGIYQVYYTGINCYQLQDANFVDMCNNFTDAYLGFLIFYNPKLQSAQVLNVCHHYYIDSAIDMDFIINDSYKIKLEETEVTDGEEEEDLTVLSQYSIEVDKHGTIQANDIFSTPTSKASQ